MLTLSALPAFSIEVSTTGRVKPKGEEEPKERDRHERHLVR
jgi:hypothetical protein